MLDAIALKFRLLSYKIFWLPSLLTTFHLHFLALIVLVVLSCILAIVASLQALYAHHGGLQMAASKVVSNIGHHFLHVSWNGGYEPQ